MANPVFLEELLAQTADGAYVVDQSQRIVAWNDAAEELLGFSAQDVVGQPCYQIIGGRAEGGCVICRRGCQPVVASQRKDLVPSFDIQVRTAHGRPRWVNAGVISMTITDDQGQSVPAIIHFLRDVEAKKQAESFAAEVSLLSRQINAHTTPAQSVAAQNFPLAPFTPREYDVLVLLDQGMDTATIAAQLLIGTPTVRNHIQRILHKLGAHSRLEAVTLVRDLQLLE